PDLLEVTSDRRVRAGESPPGEADLLLSEAEEAPVQPCRGGSHAVRARQEELPDSLRPFALLANPSRNPGIAVPGVPRPRPGVDPRAASPDPVPKNSGLRPGGDSAPGGEWPSLAHRTPRWESAPPSLVSPASSAT